MCVCTNRYIQPALFVFIVCIWFQGWLHCTGQETHPWQRLSLFLAFVPCSSLCPGRTPGRCPSSLLACLLTLPLFWSSRREFHSRLGVFWYFLAQYIIFPWVLNSIFVCLRYRTPGDKICRSAFYLLFMSFFHWAFIQVAVTLNNGYLVVSEYFTRAWIPVGEPFVFPSAENLTLLEVRLVIANVISTWNHCSLLGCNPATSWELVSNFAWQIFIRIYSLTLCLRQLFGKKLVSVNKQWQSSEGLCLFGVSSL